MTSKRSSKKLFAAPPSISGGETYEQTDKNNKNIYKAEKKEAPKIGKSKKNLFGNVADDF